MARYKPQERHSLLLPVVLSEQIVPGSFAFALDYLDYLVDHEFDLTAMDAKFKNGEVGASAYDPRVMLKAVVLAYSHGLISSRAIERACLRNVQFIAISGDSQPSHAHIAKFVSNLGAQIKPLFAQVLTTCDAQGLIGREMFAIDGVKPPSPSNASKERGGMHEELRHRAPAGGWTRLPTRSSACTRPRTTPRKRNHWIPNARPASTPCASSNNCADIHSVALRQGVVTNLQIVASTNRPSS